MLGKILKIWRIRTDIASFLYFNRFIWNYKYVEIIHNNSYILLVNNIILVKKQHFSVQTCFLYYGDIKCGIFAIRISTPITDKTGLICF